MSKTIETIVWSKMQCPYCDMAKSLLKQKNIEFEERKIVDGKYIGGYTELKAHFDKEGK